MATAGASAALTGLIFVGVSINLTNILASKGLAERALISILLLLTILIMSIILLIPEPSSHILSWAISAASFLSWIIILLIDIRITRDRDLLLRHHFIISMTLNQIAFIPYFIGVVCILTGPDTSFHTSGLGWIALSFIFSFIKAVVDAWVLLVEINR